MKKALKSQSGMTLIELLIVCAIMVVVFTAILNITMHTVRIMVLSAQENIAETGAKAILSRISEDVRMAGPTTGGGGGAGAFWDASGIDRIYITKYGKNLDAFSVPNNGDLFSDVSCYEYFPSSGVRGSAGYVPGRIYAGSDNGDSLCAGAAMTQISEVSLDIENFEIQYCRPAAGVPGTYSCSSTLDQPGNMTNNSDCVWQVRISIRAQRIAKYGAGETASPAQVVMSTTVKPRNLYFASLTKNENKNCFIDCCDGAYAGADVDWCPPPKSTPGNCP